MKDSLMSSRRPASSLKGPYMMKVDFGPQKSFGKHVSCMFSFFLMF